VVSPSAFSEMFWPVSVVFCQVLLSEFALLLPTLASGNAHDAFAHIAASVLELPRASANKQIRLQQSHEDHYSVSKSFHYQKGLRPGHDRPF